MDRDKWMEQARCKGFDTNLFFDKYEEDTQLRPAIDELCSMCPVVRECLAVGVSKKGVGVWGGVYLDNGKISREFNNHRTKADWAQKWSSLTMDME